MSSSNLTFDASSLPSGLHSYAGDISHLKLRLLFTNDEILFRRPNLTGKEEIGGFRDNNERVVNTGSNNESDKNNDNNNNYKEEDNFHSSYLIKKVRGKWIIEAEERCLIEDEGRIELRLHRMPLLSRICCNCTKKCTTCSKKSGLHMHELSSHVLLNKSELFRAKMEACSKNMNEEELDEENEEEDSEDSEEEERARDSLSNMNTQKDREVEDIILEESKASCLSEKVVKSTGNANATTTTKTNGSKGNRLNRSERAFHWKDTFTVTSRGINNLNTDDGINTTSSVSNNNKNNNNNNRQSKNQNENENENETQNRYQQQYQKRTLARKLPIEMRNIYDYGSRKNFTISNPRTLVSCRDFDNDIYRHNLLSCFFQKVATILLACCYSPLQSDFNKEIVIDRETILNDGAATAVVPVEKVETSRTAGEKITRSNKKLASVALSDLYLRWFWLLNENQNQKQRLRDVKQQIPSLTDVLMAGRQRNKQLADFTSDKLDNLLAYCNTAFVTRSSSPSSASAHNSVDVDDIVDGLESATAQLIQSASAINQRESSGSESTLHQSSFSGGNLKAMTHLKQPQITGYPNQPTATATETPQLQPLSKSANEHLSVETSKQVIREQKQSKIRSSSNERQSSLNRGCEADMNKKKKKQNLIIDERCAEIEKLLLEESKTEISSSSKTDLLNDCCCSHGEILFIIMEKHMTSLMSCGESSISATSPNFKRATTTTSVIHNSNNGAKLNSPDLMRGDTILGVNDTINKEGEGEGEGKEEEGANENGNSTAIDLKFQKHLGKLEVVKHSSGAVRLDRSNRSSLSSFLPDDDREEIGEEITKNSKHTTLLDNNKMMPDEIGLISGGGGGCSGGAINSNSSSSAADKINLYSRKAAAESSNKLINEQQHKRKMFNQTISSSLNDIEKDNENHNDKDDNVNINAETTFYGNNDKDNRRADTELWIQQERQLRRQQRQCRRRRRRIQRSRQLMRQERFLTNATTSQNDNSDSQVVFVCLGVIVIDTLNKFIQLKPDLNKLISVDVCQGLTSSTSLGFYNGAIKLREAEEVARNRCRQQLVEPNLRSTSVTQSRDLLLSEGSHSISSLPLIYQLKLVEASGSLIDAKNRGKRNTKHVRGAPESEHILNFVREQLLAPNFLLMTPSKPLDQFEGVTSIAQQQIKSKITTELTTKAATTSDLPSDVEIISGGFLTPVGGSTLIKLQFSIHFASDFAKDCHNLHVKYKLFSRTNSNSKWKLRRRLLNRLKDDAVVKTVVLGNSQVESREKNSSATTCMVPDLAATLKSRQETQKVAQMSHLLIAQRLPQQQQQQRQPQQRLTTFSTISTCVGSDDEFEKPTTKSIDCNGHPKQTVNGVDDENDDNNDAIDTKEALMADHDNTTCVLLLEGSTITSRPNSLGRFHFNCVEELVLEAVATKKRMSNTAVSTTSSCYNQQIQTTSTTTTTTLSTTNKQQKSLDSTTKEVNYDVPSRKLDQQISIRKRDENNLTASIEASTSPSFSPAFDTSEKPHDRVTGLSLKDEQQQQPHVVAKQSKVDNGERHDDADETMDSANEQDNYGTELSPPPPANIAEDTQRSRVDNKMIEDNSQNHELLEYNGEIGNHQADSNLTKSKWSFKDKAKGDKIGGFKFNLTNWDDNNCVDEELEAQEIIIALEFYSSDFYRDKLQGWSHISIPIKLTKECRGDYLSLSDKDKDKDKRRQLRWCTSTKREIVRPVIRPELCSIIDKLRYYLIGQLPESVPEVDNFAICQQRYMLQTKQSGKVMLDYEVVHQFSDPNFDRALEELLEIGKQQKNQQERNWRQKYGKTTWCPYNSLDHYHSSNSHNHEQFSGNFSSSSDEESKQRQKQKQHNMDTQQVIDAYQRAKQRIEVLNFSSFLEKKTNIA